MVLDACCRKHGSGNYETGVSWRGCFGLVNLLILLSYKREKENNNNFSQILIRIDKIMRDFRLDK